MSSVAIYLDESGDLGWEFSQPYRDGGSSRFLTVAALVASLDDKHLPKRVIKRLYKKHRWNPAKEKKWSHMSVQARLNFSTRAKKLSDRKKSIMYLSITVNKENVQPHIRTDPNKLYNYMIRCLLLEEMAKHDVVAFVPDARSIKVRSGNSLHDYLQTALWFDKEVPTILRTDPCDSSSSRNVQFADMLAGVIQSHYEDGNSDPWKEIRPCVANKTLFFGQP